MSIVIIAFTINGINLALNLASHLEARVFVPERFCEHDSRLEPFRGSLEAWTGKFFYESRALIFVSSCGIAVRAIAKYITDKTRDPAVIVIDEQGRYVIPILSGHIGGANELAKRVSALLDSHAVITTATDINNITAPDTWAVSHNCAIENPDAIKHVSSRLLEGLPVGVAITDSLTETPYPVTLFLRPRVLVLGSGCNRGVDPDEFERAALDFLVSSGTSVNSLKAIASIDIKKDEAALTSFADKHHIPLMTFTASELQEVPGIFSRSQRVLDSVGVDNVCERSCMKAAGDHAVLMRSKFITGGMTFALARVREA